MKNKMKPEFIGKSGKEIGELKKNNVDIFDLVEQKKLAYLCDSSIGILKNCLCIDGKK